MLDFKKQYKALYPTTATPTIVDVPAMTFLMLDGLGAPSTSPAFTGAIEVLYGLSYAIKMTNTGILGYSVPPPEGFWITTGVLDKGDFVWTLAMRQPDFVTAQVMDAGKVALVKHKPKLDPTNVRLQQLTEGCSVQALHMGSFDNELATVTAMEQFAAERGYETDLSDTRRHHEIYLSNPHKTAVAKLKTIIRRPIRPVSV